MFQSRVMNDVNGNYLLIMTDQVNVSGYELKMFEYNKIKGFLPITVSRINNTITYQYQIMQYENFAKKSGSESISLADIKNIFSKITLLVHSAAEYLLNVDSILLNPEYIYIDGEELLFCYYPSCNQSFNKSVRELMEYILERLDHTNQENVMTSYGIYQKILKNNFTMEGLMEEFFCVSALNEKEVQGKAVQIGTIAQDRKQEEASKPVICEKESIKTNSDIFTLEQELEAETARGDKKTKKKKGKLFPWKRREQEPLQKINPTMILAEATTYGATQLLASKKLVNISGGADIILTNFPLHVGSNAAESDCVVENVMVSRKHAVITMECGGYYIEDLDSTNGTFVNGSRLSPYEPVLMKEGDQVFLANEKYRLN